jgi:hypothetical protein
MRYIIVVFLVVGMVRMSAGEELDRADLQRQVRRLQEELVQLQRMVTRLTGDELVVRKLERLRDDADVDMLMRPVQEALADLAFAMNRLNGKKAFPKSEKMDIRVVDQADMTYAIVRGDGVQNKFVTILNVGTDVVVNPRVVVNGKRKWHHIEDMMAEIVKPDMTDREKALAIWQFLVDNRYHDQPAHNDVELHDPVRYLNVYGYGFCDDSATNLMVLAEQAGLKARVWGLEGHVVPEVFFDGGWHMLDPDGEIYYLEDDGHTIASVETLEKRPDIIRKYPSPYYRRTEDLVMVYTTTEDNQVSDWYKQTSEAKHTMAFSLRPGESLMRGYDHWGHYFSSRYLREPKKYGNGRFVFEPIWKDNVYQTGVTHQVGLQAKEMGSDWVLMSENKMGELVYRFESPYPYLDGRLVVESDGQVGVSFSEDGEAWVSVWRSKSDEKVHTTVPLGVYFRNGYGRPMYAYYVKVQLDGTLKRLRFESDIQVAPLSVPVLEVGENQVHYQDASESRQVEIGFGYDLESAK